MVIKRGQHEKRCSRGSAHKTNALGLWIHQWLIQWNATKLNTTDYWRKNTWHNSNPPFGRPNLTRVHRVRVIEKRWSSTWRMHAAEAERWMATSGSHTGIFDLILERRPHACKRQAMGSAAGGRLAFVLAGKIGTCKIHSLFFRIASHFIAQAGSIASFDQSSWYWLQRSTKESIVELMNESL